MFHNESDNDKNNRRISSHDSSQGSPCAISMKYCPVCGWNYSDTYRECPFCKEDDDDEQETPLRVRKGKRAAGFSKQFRLIAGTQILLILVMVGTLHYLLRDILPKADAAEGNFAPAVLLYDSAASASEESAEPPYPQAEKDIPASDDEELLPHTDERQSDERDEQEVETPVAPTQGDAPASDSGTASELKTGNAVVIHAENGVRVRSGPNTSSQVLASVYNGAHIQIVRGANDGWYEITFLNGRGVETTGYMMGDFLQNV